MRMMSSGEEFRITGIPIVEGDGAVVPAIFQHCEQCTHLKT